MACFFAALSTGWSTSPTRRACSTEGSPSFLRGRGASRRRWRRRTIFSRCSCAAARGEATSRNAAWSAPSKPRSIRTARWPETRRLAEARGPALRRLQHDRSRNRRRRRGLRSRGLPAKLSCKGDGSPQGALRRARRRRRAGARLSSLRADRGERRDASADRSRSCRAMGLRARILGLGRRAQSLPRHARRPDRARISQRPKRRPCSPDGATAIPWRSRRSPFISG